MLKRAAELGKRTSKPQPALLVSFQGLRVLGGSSFLPRTSSSVGSAHLKGFFGASSGLWLQQARLKQKGHLSCTGGSKEMLKIAAKTKEQLKDMQ